MNSSTLKSLLKDYEHKKLLAEIECEKRKNLIYKKYKKLQEIDDELNSYAFSTIKNILSNELSISTSNLQERINLLNIEKKKILKENNISELDFKPHYECQICNDTGYTLNSYPSTLCNCIKQKLFDIEYNKSNINNLEKENFNYFNLNLYSDEINTEKYKSNISPRQNIINIKNIAENFINNFNNPEERNLIFTRKYRTWKNFSF